jgi:hypothetical protein
MPIVLRLVFIFFRTLNSHVLNLVSGNWSSGFKRLVLSCGKNCEGTDICIWREDST